MSRSRLAEPPQTLELQLESSERDRMFYKEMLAKRSEQYDELVAKMLPSASLMLLIKTMAFEHEAVKSIWEDLQMTMRLIEPEYPELVNQLASSGKHTQIMQFLEEHKKNDLNDNRGSGQ